MSTEVSNQLDRIEGAVGDIKTAISNKGVTVPSTAKIGDLAPLVASIRVASPNLVDTSSGDAVAGEILKGKKAWVDGSEVTGTMENRGAVSEILGVNAMGVLKTSAKIADGYHNGNGQITIIGETKTVTPDESTQNIGPTGGLNGSVLTKVTVKPIPSKYKDTTGADATPAQVIEGSKFVGTNGVVESGTMPLVTDIIEGDIADDTNDEYVFRRNLEKTTAFKKSVDLAVAKSDFGNVPASMVPVGYTFTSRYGIKIDGQLPEYDDTLFPAVVYASNENEVFLQSQVNKYCIIDDFVYSKVPLSNFGDVDEWHVAEGYTFTSANGFKVTGKIPVYDYTPIEAEYSDKTDEGFIFMGSVDSGALMEDEINLEVPKERFGDAEAAHVLKDKTFTSVDGFNATGTLEKYDGSQLEGFAAGAEENNVIVVTHFEDPNYVEGDSYVYSNVPLDNFGNATASDVRVGKTFTSSAGLKEDGTMPNVGVPAPTFTAQLDDDDDSGNTVWLRASVSQSTGYTAGGNNSTDIFPKLTVSGDTATMECGEVSISRKVTDPNLKAENIKKGVTIFGIVGTYEGEGNLATVNVNIADGDWCGPYDITYTNASGAQVTETVYCNDITIAILAGTPLYISIDNSASYSGALTYDENNTLIGTYGWDENEIQLPTDGTYYSLYLCG